VLEAVVGHEELGLLVCRLNVSSLRPISRPARSAHLVVGAGGDVEFGEGAGHFSVTTQTSAPFELRSTEWGVGT
jgi:hypothetical protein